MDSIEGGSNDVNIGTNVDISTLGTACPFMPELLCWLSNLVYIVQLEHSDHEIFEIHLKQIQLGNLVNVAVQKANVVTYFQNPHLKKFIVDVK